MDWRNAQQKLAGKVDAEEAKILQLLVEGMTQPQIGKELGLHRSSVWRRVTKLKKLLSDRAEPQMFFPPARDG